MLSQQHPIIVQLSSGALPEQLQQAGDRHAFALPPRNVQYDAAAVHDDGAIAQGQRGLHVVGDHQAGQAPPGHDRLRQRQHLLRRGRVQRRGVLVQQQLRLGDAIGITQRKYSYIETGIQPLTDEILVRLADYYNVSIDYLLWQTNNPRRNK